MSEGSELHNNLLELDQPTESACASLKHGAGSTSNGALSCGTTWWFLTHPLPIVPPPASLLPFSRFDSNL
jgi:hypothetical protein